MESISHKTVKRKSLGAILAFVGFMLSPFSWWNDLFVNVPLALGFAWLVSWVYRDAFTTSFVLGYWLTNVAGLVLMQRGGEDLLGKARPYTRRRLMRDLLIALLYTGLIVLLVKLKLIAPLSDSFLKNR